MTSTSRSKFQGERAKPTRHVSVTAALRTGLLLTLITVAATALVLFRSDSSMAQAQTAPTVTGVAISSSAGPDQTYALGQRIRVALTFSEAVNVSGTPQVSIDMDPAEWGTKQANYLRGNGSTELTFAHTVVEPNISTQGIAVLADSLTLNGGSITAASSGTSAALSHSGLGHDADHKVNWRAIAPTVSGVAITSDPGADDTYAADDVIEVTLTFSEAVTVSGSPQLAIDMDPAEWGTKWAAYQSGSGSGSIVFAHTVVEPNISTQGIAVLADTLRRNGGTIRSVSSNTDVKRSHSGLAHDAGHRVDWQQTHACEPVAPSSVSALTIGQGAVVSWTLPSESCEVTGFVITAVNESVNTSLTTPIADPEARSHTFRGLTAGDHVFSVRVEYAEAPPEELKADFSTTVPDACITLAVKPYARNAVSGRITSINGTGCAARQTFDLEFRRAGYETWSRYSALPWSFIDTESDPSRPHFIFYGIDPHVPHEFRISAYDASDVSYQTDAQSVTITAQDPSETADANSPTGLRIVTNNHGQMSLQWDAFTAPAGRTLTDIVVQWKACPRHSSPNGCTGTVQSATKVADETDRNRHNIMTGLTSGTYYTARVAARTHANGQPASTATDAWSVWVPAVSAFFEPLQIWFIDDTPNPNKGFGRTFMTVDTNKGGASAQCLLDSTGDDASEQACPPRTLVSAFTSGQISGIRAIGTVDSDIRSTTAPQEGPQDGAPPPWDVRASGGAAASDGNPATHEGRIVIYSSVGTRGSSPGAIAGYRIQHRKQNADGSWPGWPTTWTEDTNLNERFRTISGLEGGTYQVRVRTRTDNSEDTDNNPATPNQVVHRYGITSEAVTVTVNTHTQTAVPSPITITPGDRKLTVEWALLDRGSIPIAYQVRHRAQGTSAWTTSGILAPRAMTLMCTGGKASFTCFNPRRHEITDLIADLPYEVELRARNANGWSDWVTSVVRPGPRDTTGPVPVSAVHTSGQTTVVVNLDETPNPSFVPAPDRFQLLRRAVRGYERLGSATDVSISGSQLTLTFKSIPSNATHVDYLSTNENHLQDVLGNWSEAFTVGFSRN